MPQSTSSITDRKSVSEPLSVPILDLSVSHTADKGKMFVSTVKQPISSTGEFRNKHDVRSNSIKEKIHTTSTCSNNEICMLKEPSNIGQLPVLCINASEEKPTAEKHAVPHDIMINIAAEDTLITPTVIPHYLEKTILATETSTKVDPLSFDHTSLTQPISSIAESTLNSSNQSKKVMKHHSLISTDTNHPSISKKPTFFSSIRLKRKNKTGTDLKLDGPKEQPLVKPKKSLSSKFRKAFKKIIQKAK